MEEGRKRRGREQGGIFFSSGDRVICQLKIKTRFVGIISRHISTSNSLMFEVTRISASLDRERERENS